MRWNTQVLTPIVSSHLSMSELTNDSTVISNSDNSITVVYSSELYAVRPLDNLINLEVKPFSREITLQSLELGSQKITDTVGLEEIVAPIAAELNIPIEVFWILPIKFDDRAIPDLESIKIDVSDFFKSAILTEGTMEFSLDNSTQLDIISMDVEIRNTQSKTEIYSETFTNIKSMSSVTRSIDLAAQMDDKPIEGQLEANIKNITIATPQGVESVIFTPDEYIAFNLEIANVKVSYAEAIFPAQNVLDHQDTVSLQDLDGIELTKALISNGYVKVNVRSTIPTDLDIIYKIPSALDVNDDKIFQFNTLAPAAPIVGSITYDSSFYFDGYMFNFRGEDNNLTNTFYNTITGKITPTPEPIPLSLGDTLFISLAVEAMEASYIEGYVGNQIYPVGPEIVSIELPDAFKDGGLTFEDIKMTIVFENSLGIPASISIDRLLGRNTTTGESANLSPLPSNFLIKEATQNSQGVVAPTITKFEISNAVNLFNIHPNEIEYELNMQLNPNGNNPAYKNFAHITSEIKVSLEIEVPLTVNADQFELRDTIDFLETSIDSPEEIKKGILSFIVYNGFPVDVDFDLYFLDDTEIQIDSLTSDDVILGAELNSEGIATESKRSKVDFVVTQDKLSNILSARKIVLVATMDTEGTSNVTFYDHYNIYFQLVGDFEYEVNGGGN